MAPVYIYVLVLTLFTISTICALPTEVKVAADEEEYRLPHIYDISSYTLNLVVPANSLTDKGTEYTGTVSIQFAFTEDTDYIALHAHHEYIVLKKVTFNNLELAQEDYSVNNITDILKISLVNPIAVGNTYALIIEFTGSLSTDDMHGFYKSSYVDKDGTTQYLVTTQFEPVHARKAFPCFDEPGFKATFGVTVTYPTGFNVLSNAKVKSSKTNRNEITTEFEQTPKMSTYLLAFIVSKFTCTGGDSIGNVPFQVCSRSESSTTRSLALEVGPQLIKKFNEFTKYDYGLSNSKIDQVAIPDFSPGAMENWGLVTYRESALLWNAEESSNRDKQSITNIMSHELSHQWFGDLVTLDWWSDTFLNEGFATYFQYHMAHEVFPDWELDKQFVIEKVQSVLEEDALPDSQALESASTTPAEISEKFGSITYDKGASIIRMLAHTLGSESFKTGLQKYLADNKLTNTLPEDLWKSIDSIKSTTVKPENITYKDIMENWIHNPGFPIITVTVNNDSSLSISQERFLIGEGTDYEWYVPITYTTSTDDKKFGNTQPSNWLVPKEKLSITCPDNTEWIILNNQQTGYYRVNYDDIIWTGIKTALASKDFGGIIELNRAQIVDDLFNLAKAGRTLYSKAFEITDFLTNDVSYYSWYSALNEYGYLLDRVGQNSKLGQAIAAYILESIKTFYESVPISKPDADNQIYTHKQVLALTWACRLGHQQCVDETKSLYADLTVNGTRPDKNLKSIVYCNGLRYSNNKSDWDFLWDSYVKSDQLSTEQVTIITALGCTKDADLLKQYLEKTIADDSEIRPQDASSVFASVYKGNPEGIAVAFDFLTENYKIIPTKYKNPNVLSSLIKGVAALFTTEEEVTKLEKFVESSELDSTLTSEAQEAIKTAKSNLKWFEEHQKDLNDYFLPEPETTTTQQPTTPDGAANISSSIIMILILAFVNKFCLN